MSKKYDYLIVGSGLFGATFAYCATRAGKKCLGTGFNLWILLLFYL